jgi:hypothetical protein
MSLSIKQLEELKAAGKIRDYNIPGKIRATKGKKLGNKGNKTKDWISKNLWAWCQANKLELKTEFRFHDVRKWRFDWFIPGIAAIEYEGVISEKSRHTTISGFTSDAEKYNAAQSMGYKVLRYTAKNYKSIIEDLNKLL